MKHIFYIVSVLGMMVLCASCDEPNELTPKTSGNSTEFLIPTGTVLSAEDREEVQAKWEEYNEAINQ